MPDDTAYRSSHADVLDAWRDMVSRHDEWRASVRAYWDGYPNHVLLQRRSGSTLRIDGLRGSKSPGDGWRYVKTADCWAPDKRLKAGKAEAERLKELRVDRLGILPGMPDMIFANGKAYNPGMFMGDDIVWALWGCTAEDVEGSDWGLHKFDGSMWDRAPLSAYYLAVEAHEKEPANA